MLLNHIKYSCYLRILQVAHFLDVNILYITNFACIMKKHLKGFAKITPNRYWAKLKTFIL